LPIYKAQKILKPECTTVHEDFRILQQRSRWVSFRSNTIYEPYVFSKYKVAAELSFPLPHQSQEL
ncbi:MAG: hypothetical protein PF503_15275, partial [Desulfobacula sp.]|jgi:hypothetical protein|nr:hypothetical protein [Desulfobacula sp.]